MRIILPSSYFLLVLALPNAFAGIQSVFLRATQTQQKDHGNVQSKRSLVEAGCPGADSFSVTFEDECNYENLKAEVDSLMTDDCALTIDEVMYQLLGANDAADAVNKVKDLCEIAYSSTTETFPFSDITQKGLQHDNEYYSGGTPFNYEVQTDDGKNVLKVDAARVRRVFKDQAQHKIIDLPTYLPSIDPKNDECNLNAAFCCWVQDRQAGDNNGNCNTPYDSQCIDKDPADNANFCYTDHSRSSTAHHVDGGFSIFGDILNGQENIEGPIHCHGFAWAQNEIDTSNIYKGNNLFYVSLYDHMYQRGYVRNAPGSSMCACAENMAVVTRADCTEIEATEKFQFDYDANTSTFSGMLVEIVDLDFNACTGADQNNDLESYYQRLVNEGKQTQRNLDELRKILVGDEAGNCNQAIEDFLGRKGIVRKPEAAGVAIEGAEAVEVSKDAKPVAVIDPVYENASEGGGGSNMPAVPTDLSTADSDVAKKESKPDPQEQTEVALVEIDEDLASAKFDPEEESLRPAGEECTHKGQCMSNKCLGSGVCADFSRGGGNVAGVSCRMEGQQCKKDVDCCSGGCGGRGKQRTCGAA